MVWMRLTHSCCFACAQLTRMQDDLLFYTWMHERYGK